MEIPESGSDQHSTEHQKSLVSIKNSNGKRGYCLVCTLNLYHHVPTIWIFWGTYPGLCFFGG